MIRFTDLVTTSTQVHIGALLIIVAFLTALPLAYFEFVKPCWECNDLRAVLAHEVGHLLSLQHADGAGELGLRYDNLTARDTCDWVSSAVFTPDDDDDDHHDHDLMLKFGTTSEHEPGPLRCLAQDDLDGLNYLYPACANVPHAPSCTSRSGGRATALRFLQVRAPSAPQPRPRAIARLRPVHVSQSFFVLYLIPLCVFAGLKIFALIVVFTQEQLAKRKLAGATKELLSGGEEKGGEDNLPEPGNTFLDRAAERMRVANEAQGRSDGSTAQDSD